MSSSNQIHDYEIPSNVAGDYDNCGLDLAKQEQDEDFYDNVSGPVSTISRTVYSTYGY